MTRLGRPPASRDGAPRKIRRLRLSDAEWEWVRDQAEAAEMTASEWIRRRILPSEKAARRRGLA